MKTLWQMIRNRFAPAAIRRLQQRFNAEWPRDPSNIGDAVRRAYECRIDLRTIFPLAYTPAGCEAFAVWCFQHRRIDCGLRDSDILSFVQAVHHDVGGHLAEAWRLQPDWQIAWPDALSRKGWPLFISGFAKRFGIDARWLWRARGPGDAPQHAPWGVNLIAHWRYPSGLEEEARQYAQAIRMAGGGVSMRDAPVSYPHDPGPPGQFLGMEDYPITIAKLGVCESFDDAYPTAGLAPKPGVYRITAWSWELARLPRSLAGSCTLADEIWTPSLFCARALQTAFPEKTVTPMLPSVSLPAFRSRSRAQFGLPETAFVFLFAFDIGSIMERKNPLGLLRAFQAAFRGDDRVHLAIKVTRGDTRPLEFQRLRDAADALGVTLINTVLPREDVAALMNACDCYVSLHRAEGFGYTMAEAMLLGKPVIATNYSANLEFMDDSTALLVDTAMVPIGPGHDPYPADAVWAEPDLDHAAALMRRVYQHSRDAQAMARRGQAQVQQLLSPAAFANRLNGRLQAIRQASSRAAA
jgi:glycosyltransferase involved in cell wall biosynthesis